MDPTQQASDPRPPRGDHIIAIVAKSIGIAAVLVWAAWSATAIALRYF